MNRRWVFPIALAILSTAALRADPSRFHLPFPCGVSSVVLFGPGDAPHHLSPRNRHAYDFDLPLASEVSAAADGVVVRAEGRFGRPTGRSEENNLVAIRHRDGLVSEYHHLFEEGVLVRAGERVERGEVIAFSGQSGKAEGPHLHFVVLQGDESVPIEFLETSGPPAKGQRCVSRNLPEALEDCWKRRTETALALQALRNHGAASGIQDLAAAIAASLLEAPCGLAPAPGVARGAVTPSERRRELALRAAERALEAGMTPLYLAKDEKMESEHVGQTH
jgi:murein DD-endopeptidase MepM/ murein hydrolase activator NlpD